MIILFHGIFAVKHLKNKMPMVEKAIWMLISMIIIYNPIIKYLLIKDMIAASLFQDV